MPASKEALAKAQAVIAKINKDNKDSVVLWGSEINFDALPRITSGSLALDVALGGGWPANQFNEIYGNESHGKTALVLKTIAANQALDPDWMVFWAASEHFVAEYAEKLGCDTSRIVVMDSNVMEAVFEAMLDALDSRAFDCVVLDSLPALAPTEEADKTMEDWQVGLGARLTGKFFRKQGKSTKRSMIVEDRPVTGFVINQFREKIGVMYGDNRTTPGGKAKNFFYFSRVEVARDEWIEVDKVRVGQTIKARVVKNKSAAPQKVAVFDFYFAAGNGIEAGGYDTVKEIINLGITHDVITRAGAFYSYAGERWQGREALIEGIRSNDGLREMISEEVLALARKQPTAKVAPVSAEVKKRAVPAKSVRRVNKAAKK